LDQRRKRDLPYRGGGRYLAGYTRWILLGLIAAAVVGFLVLDLGQYLTLGFLKSVHTDATAYVRENPVTSGLAYFVIYVIVTGLSLPGAAVMTLAGGAVFGLLWGMLLVSFASSIGATIAMLISRTLLRDWVQGRFGEQLQAINEGLQKDGGFYLFGLRMVPLFPFFVINLVMGLAPLSLWQFYWVSQVGMFGGTLVFVFAGTRLAQVSEVGDVLDPVLIVALTLLGLFPLIARKLLGWIQRIREG
jgi:uncharacterized membrane protein YdjX (TVP38/TMEM64 family)